jgi:hypothetical protein
MYKRYKRPSKARKQSQTQLDRANRKIQNKRNNTPQLDKTLLKPSILHKLYTHRKCSVE